MIGGLVIFFVAAAIFMIAMTKPAAAQGPYHTLVGQWFQSYDYIPEAARPEGSAEYVLGKTGRVTLLLDKGLYLVDFDDHPGEVIKSVHEFARWRFFPTEADLLKLVEGQ